MLRVTWRWPRPSRGWKSYFVGDPSPPRLTAWRERRRVSISSQGSSRSTRCRFAKELGPEFSADVDVITDAAARRTSFNVIHIATAFKVDVFVPRATAYAEVEMERRQSQVIDEDTGEKLVFSTAEDTLLAKLLHEEEEEVTAAAGWRRARRRRARPPSLPPCSHASVASTEKSPAIMIGLPKSASTWTEVSSAAPAHSRDRRGAG